MPVTELTRPDATHVAAAQCLLKAYRLPTGVKTIIGYLLATEAPPTVALIAREMGYCDRTVAAWILAAKQAGLLHVTRQGRRNVYRVDLDRLQHLAERGGA